ncbi:succinate dehydrogenase assembly factor 1, mitochondrial [Gallus gallus]|uniref:succinate dehydrogenase assembly factor 1, mitochondrial n=1 Tax=Gallus gallus TaxID=9031 RepID=UPI000739C614|nr:succinate dehydrogenase assembly factor 1, mitochondrial [Gallus gallus]XP_040550166.1 succinate dehydrogenase assembly factor 1, mitochondrial [Gallus gallus]|eukprot:XP_015128741.1 succinate dehydrogenase assembly factor 1, mitochondrial [Gallus gallus]
MAGSDLRREALALYRAMLRAAAARPGFAARIRSEFRRCAAVPPRDRLRAELLLRRGRRQLQTLRAPSTVRMGAFGPGSASEATSGSGSGGTSGCGVYSGSGRSSGSGSPPQ